MWVEDIESAGGCSGWCAVAVVEVIFVSRIEGEAGEEIWFWAWGRWGRETAVGGDGGGERGGWGGCDGVGERKGVGDVVFVVEGGAWGLGGGG